MEKYYKIGKEFYLIKSNEEDFHRNIYLKRFIGKDGAIVNMLMDSGTKLDIPILTEVLGKLIGGINNVHILFLSHQDPDVSANANTILMSASKSIIISSLDSWRLLRMYGIPEDRFLAVESFKSDILKIKKTGHKIHIIPATFCHFVGSMMLYDYESKVLFSGDFLAGLNSKKEEGIYATEESWEGIAMFHQIYMPVNQAIKETINRIGFLDSMPEVIAPQHGDIITSKYMGEFLQRLSNLDVGLDLKMNEDSTKEITIMALNKFGEELKANYPDVYKRMIEALESPSNFTIPFILQNGVLVDIRISVKEAIVHIYKILQYVVKDNNLFLEIKTNFINVLDEYNIVVPEELIDTDKVDENILEDGELDMDMRDLFG